MSETKLPRVSVIMPVRNEADFIERSLGAIFAQDYPAHFLEVIIADGMSTDGTRHIVSRLQARHPGLQLVDNPGRIAPTGLNAAMAIAGGEIVVRVDGHCEIAPDYVSRCVAHLLRGEADGAGGPIDTVGQTFLARAVACAMSSSFGVGGSTFRTGTQKAITADTIPFPAYTRSIIERAGPYDEELVRNQDDEYNYRIRKLGGRLLLAPDIRSTYFSRSSLRSLWRQYFQYGYWKIRVMQKHPRQMRARQFIPLLLVLALAGSLFSWAIFDAGKWALLLVGGSYLLASIFSSVYTAAKQNRSALPLLPLVFAILHISYGLGNIAGLIQFRGRWGDHRYEEPARVRERRV